MIQLCVHPIKYTYLYHENLIASNFHSKKIKVLHYFVQIAFTPDTIQS